VATAYRAVRLLDHNLPPVLGGSLDQTPSFIDAMQFILSDERRLDRDRRRNPFKPD
jgi:hypothetical protein